MAKTLQTAQIITAILQQKRKTLSKVTYKFFICLIFNLVISFYGPFGILLLLFFFNSLFKGLNDNGNNLLGKENYNNDILDIVGRGYNNNDEYMNDYLNSNANFNNGPNRKTYDLYSNEYVPTIADVIS